ncbi:hypothetical protein [Ekhidna sp.]|uniref:hypothetical protein n=1 Tax=Ekhidna sp. TaxID=2608089 RepID=UPI003298A51D
MMLYKLDDYNTETAVLVGTIFFVVFIGPILALHFNHYFIARGCSLIYNEQTGQLAYDNGGNEISFGVKDIENITVYKSWSMAKGRTPTLPTDIYNYAVIELKDGQVLKISSLLVYELDKVVKFENTEIKKTFYAWMPS